MISFPLPHYSELKYKYSILQYHTSGGFFKMMHKDTGIVITPHMKAWVTYNNTVLSILLHIFFSISPLKRILFPEWPIDYNGSLLGVCS